MSDELAALARTADDLLGDRSDPLGDGYDAALWSLLASSGLTTVGLPESAGGSGGSLAAAVVVARAAGAHAVRVPVADSALVAGALLAATGLPLPAGPVVTGDGLLEAGGGRVRGRLTRVPYARDAAGVVALCPDGTVAALDPADVEVVPGHNLAGEPRDDVVVDAAAGVAGSVDPALAQEIRLRGALARSAQIAGALGRVQRMVVAYAQQREQFGRPIAAFQAVQQQVAVLVGEASAADAAVSGAVTAWEAHGPRAGRTAFAVAAAKVRTAQAAGLAAAVAHQVHGAIGMTQEHALHVWTTRLWSWREEWGGEAAWSEALAAAAVSAGSTGLWPLVQGAS